MRHPCIVAVVQGVARTDGAAAVARRLEEKETLRESGLLANDPMKARVSKSFGMKITHMCTDVFA